MKRCPQCNRVETDDALVFCRADGTALVSDSGAVSADSGTVKFGSAPVVNEIETSILPHRTDADLSRPTAPTTVLPAQSTPGTTRELSRPKRRWAILAGGAVIVIAIVTTAYFYLTRKSSAAISSIAVMPFVNESSNADVEYLSDGMTETLISSLSQLPNLNVKARSSVFRYKGKATDAKTIGKELNVQAVLNGRVMQRGDQLTLSLELVNAETENVIWSEQYNRKQSDLVALQSEIARDVSSKLKSKLSGADVAKVGKGHTANPEAYRLYLQGRFYWNKRTGPDLKKSIEYFDQAIALDPAYAQAYSGLGDVYTVIVSYTADLRPDETFPKARAAAQKALEIDPDLAEPHVTLAEVLHDYDWKHAEAEKEYKRAIEIDPNYPYAHQGYGRYLSHMGRFDEGIAELKRALELDPLSPTINSHLSMAYMSAHRYDDAIAIDGGNPKQLTSENNGILPSISPDGRWVIFTGKVSGEPRLWKVSIDGGEPVRLTDYNSSLGVVSPDGKSIVCIYREQTNSPRRIAME